MSKYLTAEGLTRVVTKLISIIDTDKTNTQSQLNNTINQLSSILDNKVTIVDGKDLVLVSDIQKLSNIYVSDSGIISISNIPQSATPNCISVNSIDEMYALTINDVQNGDTVLITSDTGAPLMYYVVDDTKLNEMAGYHVYSANVDWDGLTNIPNTVSNPTYIRFQVNGNDIQKYNGMESDEVIANITLDDLSIEHITDEEIDAMFQSDEPVIVGTIEQYTTPVPKLNAARKSLAATTVGNYALFGGGCGTSSSTKYATVDAYDESLTRSSPTVLSSARYDLAATTVGNYALFGGGQYGSSVVDAYDTSLTRSVPTGLSVGRHLLAATTVGNYALFGGGSGSVIGQVRLSTVDAYDTSLIRSIPTALSNVGSNMSATTVGNYALFGGMSLGYVDAYDSSLTRHSADKMNLMRNGMVATTVGDYALFGGSGTGSTLVDAYDSSLTRTTATEFSVARKYLAATTVGNYALFGGDTLDSKCVDMYDILLTRTTLPMNVARYSLAAASIGNYAIFAGGYDGTDVYNTIDVYKFSE